MTHVTDHGVSYFRFDTKAVILRLNKCPVEYIRTSFTTCDRALPAAPSTTTLHFAASFQAMAVHEAFFELLTVRNTLLAFAGYVLYSTISQIIYYRFFHPLSHFPGPFWGSVTRLWLCYHNWQQTELATCYALHKKYGPVIRVTPTMLLVSDARKLPQIYHFKADKTPYYLTGSFGETESLFNMRDHRTHARFRKLIAGPYSFTKVSAMEPMMDERLQAWIQKMDESFAETGKAFDFCEWAV
jgi:hypothetical protein